MKKNYQNPRTSVLNAETKSMILSASNDVINNSDGNSGINYGGGSDGSTSGPALSKRAQMW